MACTWELACAEDGEDLHLEAGWCKLLGPLFPFSFSTILLPEQSSIHLCHSDAQLDPTLVPAVEGRVG